MGSIFFTISSLIIVIWDSYYLALTQFHLNVTFCANVTHIILFISNLISKTIVFHKYIHWGLYRRYYFKVTASISLFFVIKKMLGKQLTAISFHVVIKYVYFPLKPVYSLCSFISFICVVSLTENLQLNAFCNWETNEAP